MNGIYQSQGLQVTSEDLFSMARAYGEDCPDRQWVLTSFDTWERNPHYDGPPQRHPEDDSEDR